MDWWPRVIVKWFIAYNQIFNWPFQIVVYVSVLSYTDDIFVEG